MSSLLADTPLQTFRSIKQRVAAVSLFQQFFDKASDLNTLASVSGVQGWVLILYVMFI